jgi:quercetin dioxygenase-like cupin family protein
MVDVVNLDGHTAMRATFQPGWRWSQSVKPIVHTDSCQIEHLSYLVSGRLMIHMDDGTERELHAGDIAMIPAGHDAWVVGDEPAVIVDFPDSARYAMPGS